MPTIEDLGQLVKAKHPGDYDDLSNADLGAKVKAKYPGAYDDFADAQKGMAPPKVLGRKMTDDELATYEKGAPAATQAIPPARSWTDSAKDFASGLWNNTVGGLTAMEKSALSPPQNDALGNAAYNALGPVGNVAADIVRSHMHTAGQAVDAGKGAVRAAVRGDLPTAAGEASRALGYTGATLLPGVGPAAAAIGDQAAQGDFAKAAGGAAGLLLAPKATELATRGVSAGARGLGTARAAAADALAGASGPRPLSPAAVSLGDSIGAQMSAGDRGGSKFTQAVEKMAGSTVAPDLLEAKNATNAAAVQAHVHDLTGDFSVDHYGAGQSVLDPLVARSKSAAADATDAYNRMQAIEADPANVQKVQVGTKTIDTGAVDENGEPILDHQPVTESMGLPVDQRAFKAAVSPLITRIERTMPFAQQQMSQGLLALKNIAASRDFEPASVAEDNRSALLKIQRENVNPRVKQIAGQAIDAMQPAIDAAVAQGGPDATAAIQQGRSSYKSHMATEGLLGDLTGSDDTSGRTGQTATAEKLLGSGDRAYPMLQRVVDAAPEAADPLRMAMLGKVFKKAETGEFTNPTQAANLYNQIGKRTKDLLMSPEQQSDIASTLELSKRFAENPNPSGSGVFAAMLKLGLLVTHPVAGAAALVMGRKMARVLYDPTGAAAMRTALEGGAQAPAALATVQKIAEAPAAATLGADAGTAQIAQPGGTAQAAQPGAGQQAAPVQVAPETGVPPGQDAANEETRINVPGENRSFGARYKLRELSDIQASHDAQTFAPNPKYGLRNDRNYNDPSNRGTVINASLPAKFKPEQLVTDNPDPVNGPPVLDEPGNVIGGNGRTMILDRVYGNKDQSAANAYRSMLAEKAGQFGIDPADVQAMKQPVLTREIPDTEFPNGSRDKAKAITDMNKTPTAALTPAEQSIADSRRVSPETLDDIGGRIEAKGPNATLADALEGKSGGEVLNKLIKDGVISPQQRNAFAAGDGLSPAGRQRIGQLMLGRFFADPEQMNAVAPSIRSKLEGMAAPLARVESNPQWNLSGHVQDALSLLEEAHAHGSTNLNDFLQQHGLFGADAYPPQAVALAKSLKNMTAAELKAAVRQYAGDAHYAGGGGGLMGDAPTPAESFREAFGGKATLADAAQ